MKYVGEWVSVEDRLPERIEGKLGEIELYCKTDCGIEVIVFHDYDGDGKLDPGVFDDSSVTEWLSIPGITIAI